MRVYARNMGKVRLYILSIFDLFSELFDVLLVLFLYDVYNHIILHISVLPTGFVPCIFCFHKDNHSQLLIVGIQYPGYKGSRPGTLKINVAADVSTPPGEKV